MRLASQLFKRTPVHINNIAELLVFEGSLKYLLWRSCYLKKFFNYIQLCLE